MNREWKDTEQCQYYYNTEDGRIVGQVHNVVHTQIWLAKIIHNYNDEKYLGQYITKESAKGAVERFWNIQERTLLESA